jgi:ESCRT-II complex subunit VPS36
VLPQLSSYTDPPIQLRKFPSSGLTVLHTPSYALENFAERLLALIKERNGRTTLEVAWAESISTALAAEMIGEAEMAGYVCRDESPGLDIPGLGSDGSSEVHWWPNLFKEYIWDGQE